ncbi:Nif3-like dinuclear metal center hexameric protein [Candidatus Pacearchaeota archaeon]|nr:Nif3-like dinuclear metal center hexameric protein [Candidatus Pacearchaeota archaeon]
MEAKKLYAGLEKDFIKSGLSDEWFGMEEGYGEFLSENFKKRAMGLVCDNTQEITKVYTAVFPEDKVMQKILDDGVENAMLFLHHPLIWDIRKTPSVFQPPKKEYLEELRKRNISIYVLHVPLDNYGKYSTSYTLAEAVGIKPEKAFAKYFGALCGIFGKTKLRTTADLSRKFEESVGHKISLYQYGSLNIKEGFAAVIAGGGNDIEMLQEIAKEGVNTFVTGITALNPYSQKAHDFAKEHKINILGGTHYSTEKFACQKMCEYFRKLGLESEFISGKPVMEDI